MTRNRVTLKQIHRTARQIAEQFEPEQIILFGSYAYGQPGSDSDIDLLVVTPARNETSQAIRIRRSVDHPFPFDLIVRTPENVRRRLELADWFLREIVSRGKVLYAKANPRVLTQATQSPREYLTAPSTLAIPWLERRPAGLSGNRRESSERI
jgi:predicted nucleotidyltransferase